MWNIFSYFNKTFVLFFLIYTKSIYSIKNILFHVEQYKLTIKNFNKLSGFINCLVTITL